MQLIIGSHIHNVLFEALFVTQRVEKVITQLGAMHVSVTSEM